MPGITMFNFITVDGFFAGPNGEIDWFKFIQQDDEWNKYTHQQSTDGSTLIFGRTTYEMMKSYWTTEDAIKNDPEMARVLNFNPKIVFSKTLKKANEGPNWKNVTLRHEINKDEILHLKEKDNMTLLGSGSIVQQFSNLKLIDNYSIVIVPIILGAGLPLFKNVKEMNLKLAGSRNFNNGIVLLNYNSK